MALQAWGQLPAAPAAQELRWADRDADLPETGSSLLAYGNGRSYGDVCLNSGATLLHTRSMDRFIDFDEASGTLICEAGVLLADILALFVPRGWFLPVTPGTRFVTLGGAIANDVHGKNHHAAGSFGGKPGTFCSNGRRPRADGADHLGRDKPQAGCGPDDQRREHAL